MLDISIPVPGRRVASKTDGHRWHVGSL